MIKQKKINNKIQTLAWIIISSGILGIDFIYDNLVIVRTRSIPYYLMWKTPDQPINESDYIIFYHKDDIVDDVLVKQVSYIEDNKAFVVGAHPRSYDSNKFGMISLEGAMRVIPLI